MRLVLKRKLISVAIFLAISGCHSDDSKFDMPGSEVPEVPEVPSDQTRKGSLFISNQRIKGDVICNGNELNNEATFEFFDSDTVVNCYYGAVELGSFDTNKYIDRSISYQNIDNQVNFDLFDVLEQGAKSNSLKVLSKINVCPTEKDTICLDEINSYDVAQLYGSTDDDAVNEFLNPAVADNVEGPTSHVNTNITPEVSPGTSNNLTASFVSASAESAYEYVPSIENKPLTKSVITDTSGRPIVGLSYFSKSSQGVTDSEGQFEYLWGENIIFGIDTFELGQTKGNKVRYSLSDLSTNTVVQQNIESLILRYGEILNSNIIVNKDVVDTFSKYPNVINELINLELPNGARLGDTEYTTPNEFEEQFFRGLTQEIDTQLKKDSSWFNYDIDAVKELKDNSGYVTESLSTIYDGVSQFHIFHDNYGWGGSGWARAMRNFNLTNEAFPVLMPRADNNYWLEFGEEAAWTRGSGSDKKPYIVDATTIDDKSSVVMQRPERISKDNTVYQLPTVSAGSIGSGKVVFMGNAMYTSILSCPDNYWADKQLKIDETKKICTYEMAASNSNRKRDTRFDGGSMKRFFENMISWMVPNDRQLNIATNIQKGHAFRMNGSAEGNIYNFFVDKSFGFDELTTISSGSFGALSPQTTPLLLLQSFEIKTGGYETKSVVSDVSRPKLTVEDISDLIKYVNEGGNIIFFDALEQSNPEPVARLADAAGVSIGGANVAKTLQSYCGDGFWCHNTDKPNPPNLHAVAEHDVVVLERFSDTSKLTINDDGSITWPSSVDMPKLEIPTYKVKVNDKVVERAAFHIVKDEIAKHSAIQELKENFPGVPVCKDDYQYEVNCIEVRSGHGIPSFGNHHRPNFTRYPMSPEVVEGMVKAANLGANIDKLFSHEVYYRSKGKEGVRLSQADLTATYDNLSIWLWNDTQYEYNAEVQDELGFKRLVEMLNCYTDDKHSGGMSCSESTKSDLVKWGLLNERSELNPSYPLNWMEKPLTRIMLGRSYWDLDITVDTNSYPGKASGAATTASVDVFIGNRPVVGTAGNMQSTGLWAPQLEEVVVSGGVKATIHVALVDDLTGRESHELSLRRPPRVQKSFEYDGNHLAFKVPYGGLIYIQPYHVEEEKGVTYTFSGVLKADYWNNGKWVNKSSDGVPLAEIDTGHFIYTTPVENTTALDVDKFVEELNFFAESASDFYGRDSKASHSLHQRFTSDALPGFRHRFVNDVQISIGAAHSGYPVQSSTYDKKATVVPTKPLDDWLLWHEVGHNLASAPFNVVGSTEVVNNILALYMQEKREDKPYMERIESDIQKSVLWLERYNGHAWSEANNNMKLAMFGQLKRWAEENFDLSKWQSHSILDGNHSIFDQDQGWNMFKLMHRLARAGDDISNNYCSSAATGLRDGDLLMVCASYVSGYDLSPYFEKWNPGESKAILPDGSPSYSGGITQEGLSFVANLKLPQPATSPERYTTVH